LVFVPASIAQLAITSLQASGQSVWICGQVRKRRSDEQGDARAKGGNGGAVTLFGKYFS